MNINCITCIYPSEVDDEDEVDEEDDDEVDEGKIRLILCQSILHESIVSLCSGLWFELTYHNWKIATHFCRLATNIINCETMKFYNTHYNVTLPEAYSGMSRGPPHQKEERTEHLLFVFLV